MFDTHCHIFDKSFEGNLDTLIVSAREVGVTYFVVPSVSIETSKQSVNIANAYQNVFAAVGIHPTEKLLHDNIDGSERALSELCLKKKVVALGETGLDYYRYKSSRNVQKEYFKMHMKLAIKNDKALILHDRQSTNDVINLLETSWQPSLKEKVVFHCSCLQDEVLAFAKEKGAFLGIDGDITYDKFKQTQLKKVSFDRILLETDSPYLLPEPLRSQRMHPNYPANLAVIANFVAKLLAIKVEDLVHITTQNAKRVFGIVD